VSKIQNPLLIKIRNISLIALGLICLVYLFWPRSQMGLPLQVQPLVEDRYLPTIQLPEDSLLSDLLHQKATLSPRQEDSLWEQIPDTTLSWMKARIYRAWFYLDKREAGQAMTVLESRLPDSSWAWLPERHWYLALARTQSGKLSQAMRVLDSVPTRFSPEKDSLASILLREITPLTNE
jgi:hypothetical protein